MSTQPFAIDLSAVEPPQHEFHWSENDWIYVAICVGLVLIAGLMSGLTLGILSQDPINLATRFLATDNDPNERKQARTLFNLLKKHHWVLVTLLVVNAAAMEALPIFLDLLVHPFVAVIISVTCVLLFGEILPQAICGRYGLAIGYYASPLVWVLMFLTAPVSFTIGKFLDCVLGHNTPELLSRSELAALTNLHTGLMDGVGHGDVGSTAVALANPAVDTDAALMMASLGLNQQNAVISSAEARVVRGALALSGRRVSDIYRPICDVYTLTLETLLDVDTISRIAATGLSRVPVKLFDDSDIGKGSVDTRKSSVRAPRHAAPFAGMLLVKQLLKLLCEMGCDSCKLSDVAAADAAAASRTELTEAWVARRAEETAAAAAGKPVPSSSKDLSSDKREGSDTRAPPTLSALPDGRSGADSMARSGVFETGGRPLCVKGRPLRVGECPGLLYRLPMCGLDLTLYDALETMITGRSQMMLVMGSDRTTAVGIVTMEDVLEALLGEEIYDELDEGPGGESPPSDLSAAGSELAKGLASSAIGSKRARERHEEHECDERGRLLSSGRDTEPRSAQHDTQPVAQSPAMSEGWTVQGEGRAGAGTSGRGSSSGAVGSLGASADRAAARPPSNGAVPYVQGGKQVRVPLAPAPTVPVRNVASGGAGSSLGAHGGPPEGSTPPTQLPQPLAEALSRLQASTFAHNAAGGRRAGARLPNLGGSFSWQAVAPQGFSRPGSMPAHAAHPTPVTGGALSVQDPAHDGARHGRARDVDERTPLIRNAHLQQNVVVSPARSLSKSQAAAPSPTPKAP